MTFAAAYEERVDETSETLASLRRALNEEERMHLGVELMDTTRAEDDETYREVITPWFMTVLARGHPDFALQVKEYDNLVQSNELLAGVDLPSTTRLG